MHALTRWPVSYCECRMPAPSHVYTRLGNVGHLRLNWCMSSCSAKKRSTRMQSLGLTEPPYTRNCANPFDLSHEMATRSVLFVADTLLRSGAQRARDTRQATSLDFSSLSTTASQTNTTDGSATRPNRLHLSLIASNRGVRFVWNVSFRAPECVIATPRNGTLSTVRTRMIDCW